MSLDRRIERLEAWQQRQLYRQIAAEFGMDPDELQEEAEDFFSQSLEDQLAEIDRLRAEMEAEGVPWEEADEIKATLVREYRP
jgi:protein-disulfide isomerase-like protein with CxxC motif